MPDGSTNARICGSTASTIEPFAARRYRDGSSLARAFFTVLRGILNRRAMAWIAIPSDRRSRRILHAQHLPMLQEVVPIQPEPCDQFSGGADRTGVSTGLG